MSKICSIDTETTGLSPKTADVISICILPLNNDFTVDDSIRPLVEFVRPVKIDTIEPGALKVNGHTVEEIMAFPPREVVVPRIINYMTDLGQISPLAQNWAFDKGFIEDLIGGSLNPYMDYQARDTQRIAAYIQDRQRMAKKPVLRKTSLKGLCEIYGIAHDGPHTALGDAKACAALYRHFVMM